MATTLNKVDTAILMQEADPSPALESGLNDQQLEQRYNALILLYPDTMGEHELNGTMADGSDWLEIGKRPRRPSAPAQ